MLNYYKIKGYVDCKLIVKVGLLKNNSKVGLFTADGWNIGLLISIFLFFKKITFNTSIIINVIKYFEYHTVKF